MDIAKRDTLIQEYINRGFSIIPIKADKKPYVPWKEFQTKRATIEDIKNWESMFPDFNTGIVTGSISHFYVLDFDTMNSFEAFPDEFKDTMLTKTRRGMHLCFYSDKSLKSRSLVVNGHKVEFRGEGQYTIEPYAVIGGFEYEIIKPVTELKELPVFVEDLINEKKNKGQATTKKAKNNKWQSIRIRTSRLCVYQILNRELSVGERDLSLFILRNLLLEDHHKENFINYLVSEKNNSLSYPLEPLEIESILSGKFYPVTCQYVKEMLPYIKCNKCAMNKKRADIDFISVLSNENHKFTLNDLRIAIALLYGFDTPKSIAVATGLSQTQVYRSLKKLKNKADKK